MLAQSLFCPSAENASSRPFLPVPFFMTCQLYSSVTSHVTMLGVISVPLRSAAAFIALVVGSYDVGSDPRRIEAYSLLPKIFPMADSCSCRLSSLVKCVQTSSSSLHLIFCSFLLRSTTIIFDLVW